MAPLTTEKEGCVFSSKYIFIDHITQLNNNRCILTHVCVDTLWIWITAANAFLTLVDLLTDLFGVLSIFQTNPWRSITPEAVRACSTLITRDTVLTLVAFIAGIGTETLCNIVKYNGEKVESLTISIVRWKVHLRGNEETFFKG